MMPAWTSVPWLGPARLFQSLLCRVFLLILMSRAASAAFVTRDGRYCRRQGHKSVFIVGFMVPTAWITVNDSILGLLEVRV